jgi:hypothetical protein
MIEREEFSIEEIKALKEAKEKGVVMIEREEFSIKELKSLLEAKRNGLAMMGKNKKKKKDIKLNVLYQCGFVYVKIGSQLF